MRSWSWRHRLRSWSWRHRKFDPENRVPKKLRGHPGEKLAPKSRNSCRLNGRGCDRKLKKLRAQMCPIRTNINAQRMTLLSQHRTSICARVCTQLLQPLAQSLVGSPGTLLQYELHVAPFVLFTQNQLVGSIESQVSFTKQADKTDNILQHETYHFKEPTNRSHPISLDFTITDLHHHLQRVATGVARP